MDENILISKTVQRQTLFFFYQNGTLVRLSAKLKWLKAKNELIVFVIDISKSKYMVALSLYSLTICENELMTIYALCVCPISL